VLHALARAEPRAEGIPIVSERPRVLAHVALRDVEQLVEHQTILELWDR
jgi:hypothetical protein